MSDVILESERLILRYQCETDIPFLVEMWSDVYMTKYTGGPRKKDYLNKVFTEIAENPKAEEYDLWVVEQRSKGVAIGYAGFIPKLIDEKEYIEINYYINQNQQGNGYATEIGNALIKYAFENKALQELIAIIDAQNIASIKVATKIGMKFWKNEIREGNTKDIYIIESKI